MIQTINVVDADFAGSETAYQLTERGVKINLVEMRPVKQTPTYHTNKFTESIYSNSSRGNTLTSSVDVSKKEVKRLNSMIIEAADRARVPVGDALAVDRHDFSGYITETLKDRENITVINKEINAIPSGCTIVAIKPLTIEILAQEIVDITGKDQLHFYGAAAPIIGEEPTDIDRVYSESRYDKGEAIYLSCPMTEDKFNRFYDAVLGAGVAPVNSFEKEKCLKGCMPSKVMIERGRKTLPSGPVKPVRLEDPKIGKRPYAMAQLGQDDVAGILYDIVGFQMHSKREAQEGVIKLVPGLGSVDIVRYGIVHRNIFINSPDVSNEKYESISQPNIQFAGQTTGVESYVESTAGGLVTNISLIHGTLGKGGAVSPREAMIGGMAYYTSHAKNSRNFQPMNTSFELLPSLEARVKDEKERYETQTNRASDYLENFKKTL